MADIDMQAELQIGGTWTNATPDARTNPGVKIKRGRPDEGARVDPSTCNLTLLSPDGLYSGRNPNSPYFGLLGRNTPLRVSVSGPVHLKMAGVSSSSGVGASTPDTAALDITGDIDVRFDAALTNWIRLSSSILTNTVELLGKFQVTGNNRSWALATRNGRLRLEWSTDGTTALAVEATAGLPLPASERLAVRFTLDVNNGASGHTVTFYTAPTLAGPWTVLGAPVVTAGTTSIYSSAAPLYVGQAFNDLNFECSDGHIYGAEIRNGINGTIVAAPDFTAQTVGDTSFPDTVGRTWTVGSRSEISDRWYRLNGEASSWPPRWGLSGHNMQVPVEGSGPLRRLGQGAKALDSTLRRRVPSAANLLAYWPLEEGADADGLASSPVPGVKPLSLTQVTWAAANSLPSSNPLPTLNSNGGDPPQMRGNVPAPTGSPTGWQVRWVYRLDTPNTTLYTYMRILASGTVREWFVQSKDTESRVRGYDNEGVLVVDNLIGTGADLFGQWTTVNFNLSQSGGTVTWQVVWQDVGGDAGQFAATYSGTIGRVTAVTSPSGGFGAGLDGMAIGHIAVFSASDTDAFDGAITAYTGETAGARAVRLTTEEDIPFRMVGPTDGQTLVGPQTPQTVLELLGEAEQADGGILYEDRDRLGLMYRGRSSLYNQAPALTVSYGQLTQPFDPIDDDARIRNDVTVVRDGGSSSRVQITEGPLSVAAPPSGVGIYDESVTLSLNSDAQTEGIAGWLAHLGTIDEARYQSLTLLLHESPDLIPAVLALDIGDVVRVTDLPSYLPPGPVDLLVEGYSEDIGPQTWTLTLVCSPASAWQVGVVGDPVYARADTSGCVTAGTITATDTAMDVLTTVGRQWATSTDYPGEFPFDVTAGGEQMTVSAITQSGLDTFGRTVASGWGNAESGQVWSTEGGAASDYAVSGGVGTHTLTTSAGRYTTIPVGGADVDMQFDWNASALPTGGGFNFVYATVRFQSTADRYHVRVIQSSGGGITAALFRQVAGAATQIGSTYNYAGAFGPTSWFTLRFAVIGSQLSAKIWLRGTAEPTTWQLSETDVTFLNSASIGVISNSNTTTYPVTISFDNFTVLNQQRMTVTRSVNGIVKAQAAGTDVRLAHPTIAAL